MAMLACTVKRAEFDQPGQITCCRRRSSPSDRLIVPCAQPSFEAIRAFREHAEHGFLLPFIDVPLKAVEQPRLFNEETNLGQGTFLCFQHDFSEPVQPVANVETLAGSMQSGVIVLSVPMDGFGQGGQSGRVQGLGERFFSDCSPDPAIAVLEGMDAFEPEVSDARPHDGAEGRLPIRRAVIEPGDEGSHLHRDLGGRWRFKVDAWCVEGTRNDLHRIVMRSIASDIRDIAPAVHKHRMPAEEDFVFEGQGIVLK